jgi:LysR family pca operon transcriptional activator
MMFDGLITIRNGVSMASVSRILQRFKLRDLDILLAVIQTGGMGRAARSLNMSQPAVSKAIADLERAIGVQLLDRSRHGVAPTSFGLALSRRGVAVFDELRQGMKEIEFLSDPTQGEIKIGATEPLAAGPIAACIERLSRQNPGFVFHVVHGDGASLLRQLDERAVELVIARTYAPIADHMRAETLYRDRLLVAAGTRNPWTRRRNIDLADLVGEPWALPLEESQIGATFRQAFIARGVSPPQGSVITHSLSARYQLLAGGRFLTMDAATPLRFVGKLLGVRPLPLDLPTTERAVAAITLKSRSPSPLVTIFIDHLRAVIRSVVRQAPPASVERTSARGR